MIDNFALAHKLNTEHHELLLKEQLHFRASVGTMSLIELSAERPELGISCNIKKYKQGTDVLDHILQDIAKVKSKSSNQRLTPEKELQAWIIRDAILHNHQLPFDRSIQFITSELALQSQEFQKKVVVDIIGYSQTRGSICVIEIKYARHLKRLVEQVENFESVISEKQNFFQQLLKVHGIEANNTLNVEKIIIWPYAESVKASQHLSSNNISGYGYIRTQSGYDFLANNPVEVV